MAIHSLVYVMRGQKRVLKGVYARLQRAMDARERAYDPRIHFLREKPLEVGWIAGSKFSYLGAANQG
jgi:hypothetical protein